MIKAILDFLKGLFEKDTMRDEYDFSKAKEVDRSKYTSKR